MNNGRMKAIIGNRLLLGRKVEINSDRQVLPSLIWVGILEIFSECAVG